MRVSVLLYSNVRAAIRAYNVAHVYNTHACTQYYYNDVHEYETVHAACVISARIRPEERDREGKRVCGWEICIPAERRIRRARIYVYASCVRSGPLPRPVKRVGGGLRDERIYGRHGGTCKKYTRARRS